MKVRLAMALMLCCSMNGFAQYVTKGKVVDKYGNPLSEATVQGKGTTKYTTTGIDGTFTLETTIPVKRVVVSSLGKNSCVKKVKGETIVKLKDKNWFTQQPDAYHWFANLEVGLLSKDSKDVPLGVMGGLVKNIGFFAKVMYSGLPSTDGWYAYGYTGNYKTGYFSAVAGPVVRLFGSVYFYAGAGYVIRKIAFEADDHMFHDIGRGEYVGLSRYEEGYEGLAIDAGFMANFKRVMVNVGYSVGGEEPFEHRSIHFGAGYKF